MIRVRLLGAALALAAVASLAAVGPANAQTGEQLDLVSQTTFITEDAVEFTLRIRDLGPERALRVQVAPPREDPLEIAQMLRDPLAESDYTVADFRIENLEELVVGSTNLVSVVLPDEEIGLFLRREPGALPVRLDLVDPNGVVLDTLLTALILEDTTLSARIDLGFVADGRTGLSHTTDGISIDPTPRWNVSRPRSTPHRDRCLWRSPLRPSPPWPIPASTAGCPRSTTCADSSIPI